MRKEREGTVRRTEGAKGVTTKRSGSVKEPAERAATVTPTWVLGEGGGVDIVIVLRLRTIVAVLFRRI